MQLAVVAAGFTPGEADQLRRSMAAWKRKGGLEQFEQRLLDGMREQRLRRRVRGADLSSRSRASANTAFPNRTRRASRCWSTSRRGSSATSRRRSPARCSTASRWVSIRRRNSRRICAGTAARSCRPMPAVSDWECTLETIDEAQALPGQETMAAGCRRRDLRSRRCVSACAWSRVCRRPRQADCRSARSRPFDDVADLVRRAELNRHDIEPWPRRAHWRNFSGHRRRALWDVSGIERMPPLLVDRRSAKRCRS